MVKRVPVNAPDISDQVLLKVASDWGPNKSTTSTLNDNVDAGCTIQSCHVPSLDEEGIIVLDQASRRLTERKEKMARHHKMIESMESRKLELQTQQNKGKLQLKKKTEVREE